MKFKNLIPTQWNTHSEPVRYNPEFSFISLNRDMDRIVNHFNRDFFDTTSFDFHPISKQSYFPKVDVTETKNDFLISAELPGMDDKDVDVTLDNGTLSLKGEKKIEKEDKQQEYYSAERSYGSFQRSFQIPETIDQNKIAASFIKGILAVKLPKVPEAKEEVKNIPINH